MAISSRSHSRIVAVGKPIPPAYMPAPPTATDSQRMIHALEFIAERLAGIEARIAALLEIQEGSQHLIGKELR
jgi:hypothetical protein